MTQTRFGSPLSSACERVEASLSAIENQDDKFHAVSQLFREEALRKAEALDAPLDPKAPQLALHGIPYLAKELCDIAGYRTEFGSTSYATLPATRTATAIQRLNDAGAVLLGTTHMVEFAIGSWGTNYVKGTPWNPCDLNDHRIAGGSSSGSAVAVAAGYVPVAIGSDTGGSVRIPASLCGVVGYKPSFGLIPIDGVLPLGPTFDALGTLTRTIDDARLFTEVMASADLSHADVELDRLKIAIVAPNELEPIDPKIRSDFEKALAVLQVQGAEIRQIDLPMPFVEFQKLNGDIVGFEAYSHLENLASMWTKPVDPYVRNRVLHGKKLDRKIYLERLNDLAKARADFHAAFQSFDLLALPGTPITAQRVEDVDETIIPMSRFTRIANCLDLCAITLPMRRAQNQLPAGFQLCAQAGNDALLLSVAEKVFPEI